MTPLHWATEKGHAHVMEALIKHGADTTCENKVRVVEILKMLQKIVPYTASGEVLFL